jgi:hypothetical protein
VTAAAKPSGYTEYRVAFESLLNGKPEAWGPDFYGPYPTKAEADKRAAELAKNPADYHKVVVESRTVSAWGKAT